MMSRIFLVFFCCFSLSLHADISVSPIITDLVGKDASTDIAVKNIDLQHTMYVEITAFHLINPANHAAPRKRVTHPGKDGLLVFPAKLVLLPGQTQFVRVVKTTNNLAADEVYEVDFIPKISTRLVSNSEQGIKLGIRVIVGYGARVTLRPDNMLPSLSIKRVNHELFIKNTGNTSLSIHSCRQQVGRQKTEIPLPAYTLFVGQTIKQQLTHQAPVTLDVSFMGKPLAPFHTN